MKSKKVECDRQPTWQVTLTRWATLALYGWLAALVVYRLQPWLAYLRPENLFPLTDNPLLYALLQITWIFVAVLLVQALQAKFFIRFPRKNKSAYHIDIQTFVRYPALHVSVVVGILILLLVFYRTSIADNNSLRVLYIEAIQLPVCTEKIAMLILSVLDDYGLVAFLGLYWLIFVLRTNYQRKLATIGEEQSDRIDLLTCDDKQFKNWLSKEADSKTLDFFDRTPYIERMLERIDHEKSKDEPLPSKGQILLGDFGSGKTTIVNLLEKDLGPEWIVSRFDCWQRSGKPEELATQLMEQIIYDVGQQFEVTSLVGLPESFARAMYGASHWWQLLDILLRPETPENVIQKLDTLLRFNYRKLLLVVENVDRNEKHEHFINIIAAMLDKFQLNKDGKNIKFIFSADEQRLDKIVTYRIADYKERVVTFVSPDLLLRFLAMCLDKTLNDKKNGELLIIPYLKKDFSLPDDAQGKISAVKYALGMAYLEGAGIEGDSIEGQVLEKLARMLANPRYLKHVLRNVYELWLTELAGEVHLFDLLLYSLANEEGTIKKGMERFTPEILNGSGDDPFTSSVRREWKQGDDNNQSDIPIYNDADLIAFYLLNGCIAPGHSCKKNICQPVIDVGGVSEESFAKYRKIVDTGVAKGYASSDQAFLKNYINASGTSSDQQAVKYCLDFALTDWVIFGNLLDTMTRKYFSSVTQLYRFTHNSIVLADQKYAGTMSGAIRPLISLCFEVMNFDGSGGESHADELEKQLIEALQQLVEQKQYSYLLRALTFVLWSEKSDLRSRVINTVVNNLLTRELSDRMAKAFRGDHVGTHELQYEYILFLPALEKFWLYLPDLKDQPEYLIAYTNLREACHSFLIVMGKKLEFVPGVMAEFAQRYFRELAKIKEIVKKGIEATVLNKKELSAWQELVRVVPESKKADDPEGEHE
ncbi:MAG: P-loop NTPase fold protein [Thalassolituus sp.]